MKILPDECLPLDFRHNFPGHEAHTAQWAGFKGKKNGELLRAAELAAYDVLITVDQGIPHEHNVAGRKLSIILIRPKTSQIQDLLPFVKSLLEHLKTIGPSEVVSLG